MWIARDRNKVLYLYKNKPQKIEKDGIWKTDAPLNLIKIGCGGFDIPEVQWEDDEPTEVYIAPKRKLSEFYEDKSLGEVIQIDE